MLIPRAENLWTVDARVAIAPGVPFPARMTVLRLKDGSLVLWSPVPMDEALAAELGHLGPVSALVAPSRLHHLFLAPARDRHPEARIFGAPGLAEKRPDIRFESIESGLPAEWDPELAAVVIEGAPTFGETVWFHRPSRTLVAADLAFNVVNPPSWTTSAVLLAMGARGRLAQSRAWGFAVSDPVAAARSCERIFDWDFDRLIVAHGDVVDAGAKPLLGRALTRMGGFRAPERAA